jgi:hypothetical protein
MEISYKVTLELKRAYFQAAMESVTLLLGAAMLVVSLLFLFRQRAKRAQFVSLVNKLPGPPAYPIIGNSLDLVVPRNRKYETNVVELMRPWFNSRQGQDILLISIASRPVLGPTQSPIKRIKEALSSGVMRRGREPDHPLPSKTGVSKQRPQATIRPAGAIRLEVASIFPGQKNYFLIRGIGYS